MLFRRIAPDIGNSYVQRHQDSLFLRTNRMDRFVRSAGQALLGHSYRFVAGFSEEFDCFSWQVLVKLKAPLPLFSPDLNNSLSR